MLVLLIDGVGRTREMEIPCLMPVVLVPIPQCMTVVRDEARLPAAYPTARFELSRELSYPPVYRYVGTA